MNVFQNTSAHLGSTLATAALSAACLLALAGCAGSGERTVVVNEAEELPTITVTAESDVKTVPDKAEIGVAVTTQAGTAQDTQARNAEGVNAVTDALRALGVDEKSIQTSDTWLNPRYDYSESTDSMEPAAAAETTGATAEVATDAAESDAAIGSNEDSNIVGYEMTTRLTISDLDVEKVGEVLQACVDAGANNTDGIRYYSSNYDAAYDEALAAAVDAAHAKAEVLAKAGGVKLGSVYNITEGYQDTAYRYENAAMESAADGAAMKTMPGEIAVTANVTVSYETA